MEPNEKKMFIIEWEIKQDPVNHIFFLDWERSISGLKVLTFNPKTGKIEWKSIYEI